MKISAIASPSGQAGQVLGNIEVGRTANPIKMERARAIARGEAPRESVTEAPPTPVQNVRKITMRTQQSTNREEIPEQVEAAQSSNREATEQGVVEDTRPLSPQFAALARQKRALQVKERELMELKKTIDAGSVKDGAPDLIARLKSQPLSVLQEHGVTYDQLTEAIIANSANPEIQSLKEELAALKKGVKETFDSKEQENKKAALGEMRKEAVLLSKEGDSYALVRETQSIPTVMQLIEKVYDTTGEVLDVSEALKLVEDELIVDAKKLAGIGKVRSSMEEPAPIPTLQSQKPQMRTLTARDTASPVLSRRARAIAAAMGTLRK